MHDTYGWEETQTRGHGDFVMGVLAGAALGAAVALLYAPVRGREARDRIGASVKRGVDRASSAVERGRELAAQGRQLAEQGRDFVSTAKETVSQAVAEGRDAYRRVKENA
jgi:gas vesicle protein